ncbi:hypothetical protein ANRL3_02276 [Anaerolineae bacterium]|nr:hypothetical protein ANRL3_02276 [Anaerolineae bacterium]
MKKPVLYVFLFLLSASTAWSDECRFKYWEVIPNEVKCDIFHLPDFDFRRVAPPADAKPHIRRFCKHYQVISTTGKQETGYCHTGLGDVSGPTFQVNGTDYLADMAFQGCLDDKPVQGIVFVQGSWADAPKYLRRLWPVESLPDKVSCER